MATSTSIATYHDLKKTKTIARQEFQVATEVHRLGIANIAAIAKGLNMEKSTVSARLNNLKNRESFRFHGGVCRLALDRVAVCPITRRKTQFYTIVNA